MKICIVGYGSIGKRHKKILEELYPSAKFDIIDPLLGYYNSLAGTYDLGLVCTSTSSHLEQAKNLRDKCGFIFVEKPLHTSLEEIKENREVLKDTKMHVGCNIRYTDAVNNLKSVKDPALVRVTSMSNLLKWRHDPEKKSYSFHKDLGGGVLMDFVHEPDYIYSMYGLPLTSTVLEKRLYDDLTIDSTDSCMMMWSYEDKFVSFCLSYGSEEYVRRIDVLKKDGRTFTFHITRDDIERSYKKQWIDIFETGPKNSYVDCLQLYEQLLR